MEIQLFTRGIRAIQGGVDTPLPEKSIHALSVYE